MAFFTTARLLSAVTLVTIAAPVAATAGAPAVDTRTTLVSVADLDLAKPADQAVLRHRIVIAAHKVCGDVTPGDALSPGYTACIENAKANADMQVQSEIAKASTRAMIASIDAK
jgi:UrcA family protein